MEIVFLDAATLGEIPELKMLERFGNVSLYPTSSPNETINRIRKADIVLTNKVVIDSGILDAATRLKLICVTATGTNNIDMDYAAGKGIQVRNVKGYSTDSVAQVTFGFISYLLNHISYYDRYVKEGNYSRTNIFTHIGPSFPNISGKRFGIIGLGTIGKKVATIAEAFGAEVVYFSTSGQNNDSNYTRLTLEQLLTTSDIVSIHSPLNEKTRGLLSYNELQKMKPTAILINTGRGGIIDEESLARALNESLIAGAALDVMEQEPIKEGNPLLSLHDPDKLVFAPHIAWSSKESRKNLMELTCHNIEAFLKSE